MKDGGEGQRGKKVNEQTLNELPQSGPSQGKGLEQKLPKPGAQCLSLHQHVLSLLPASKATRWISGLPAEPTQIPNTPLRALTPPQCSFPSSGEKWYLKSEV